MSELLKLNLGACETRINGFLSVDIREDLHPDIVADLRCDNPFEPNTVETIYCSHMLEHIRLDEAWVLMDRMAEWLVPGGVLFVAVPDFARLAIMYIAGDTSEGTRGLIWGGSGGNESHKFGWTRDHLVAELTACGFRVIESFEPFVYEPSGQLDWSRAPSIRLRCVKTKEPR